MRQSLLLIVLPLFYCLNLYAQEVEVYERLPKYTGASLIYTQYTTNSFESESLKGTVTSSELKATLSYPLEIQKNRLTIINGIDFILLSAKVKEDVNDIDITRNFYTIAYNLGLSKEIGKKHWSVMAFLKPTLASDFQEPFSAQDFIFQVAGFTTKRVNKFWEFGFGLSLNTRFGNEQLLPLLYLFRKKERWETNIFIPSHIQQFYCFEKSKVGVSLEVDGNNYNFGNTVIPNLDLDKLSYSRVNIGPMYEFQLLGDIYANVQGGATIMNQQTWNNQFKEKELDLTPTDKLFFRVALKFLK